MKEVSDRVIVILVIVAVLVSIFSTFIVVQTASSARLSAGAATSSNTFSETDSTAGYVTLVVINKEDDNYG